MRSLRVCLALVCAGVMGGCAGSGQIERPPDLPQAVSDEVAVGPFVIRPAAATSLKVFSLSSPSEASFAAFAGVTVDYIAIRELMDRVVFRSLRSGSFNLHVCDFFGDNLSQITFNSRPDSAPRWSPDGTMLAWTYDTLTASTEILVRPADGGAATNLTQNAAMDTDPTWSPDGRWIAFHSNRDGVSRIHKVLVDGTNTTRVTPLAGGSYDGLPDWAPDANKILFISNRSTGNQIHCINADGTGLHLALSSSHVERDPAWHPNGSDIAYVRYLGSPLYDDIYMNDFADSSERSFESSIHTELRPRFSSDGRYLFFASQRDGGMFSIFAKETEFPYRFHRITDATADDTDADLGSPTVQISRVLIGPAGSDHGYDPIHPTAVAGVVAFDGRGYLNFVRLGVPPASGSSLTVTPLGDVGGMLVGVILSAPDMYYVEEDAGMGIAPIMWDFTGATSRTCVLYLHEDTGKLVSVVDVGDSVHSASADTSAHILHEQAGGKMIAHGDFKRVWDADGELVAEGKIGSIEMDAANRVVRSF